MAKNSHMCIFTACTHRHRHRHRLVASKLTVMRFITKEQVLAISCMKYLQFTPENDDVHFLYTPNGDF